MYSYPYENAYLDDREFPSFNRGRGSYRTGPIVKAGNQTGEAPTSYVFFHAIGKPKDGSVISRLTQSTFRRYGATNVRLTFTVYKHRSRVNRGSTSWQKQTDGGWARSIGGGALSLKVKLLDSYPPLDTSTQAGKKAVEAMLATAKVVAPSLPKNRSVKITVGSKVHDGYKTPVDMPPDPRREGYGETTSVLAPSFTPVLVVGAVGIAAAYALGVNVGSQKSKRGSRAKHSNKQRAAIGAGMGSVILGSPGAAVGAAVAAKKGTRGGAAGSAFAGSLIGSTPLWMVNTKHQKEAAKWLEGIEFSERQRAPVTERGQERARERSQQEVATHLATYPPRPGAPLVLALIGLRAAGAAASAYYWTEE